jgi:hypothetical protein
MNNLFKYTEWPLWLFEQLIFNVWFPFSFYSLTSHIWCRIWCLVQMITPSKQFFQPYHGNKKVFWWWQCLFCTRPTHLVQCLFCTRPTHLVHCLFCTRPTHLVQCLFCTRPTHLVQCLFCTRPTHLVQCLFCTRPIHLVQCLFCTRFGYVFSGETVFGLTWHS